ncbi:dihydroneopterin aldolase [Variovorax sp. OV329]|uniref:dihydroneopterin aldolase n=1 Tax=Variovorax sp. OV329 TaxID=1882825 RepID=UPI0008E8AB96|nr:dihydroneopterin aldolase [Variovorax sp. OV329]SFL95129.1 dihydroneopterin aldolase [Variovorax sp. OV329]
MLIPGPTLAAQTAHVPSSALQQRAAESPALDLIFIEGFTGQTVIGLHESEWHDPQPLVIDVHAGLARSHACDTDRIGDTIDYGEVCERLRRLMAEHRFQLLEAFAETVAAIVIHEFGAAWVRVKVVKPRKFADVQAVGVQIERRASPVAESPSRAGAVLRLIGSGMVPSAR